jgi:hypothetical protein
MANDNPPPEDDTPPIGNPDLPTARRVAMPNPDDELGDLPVAHRSQSDGEEIPVPVVWILARWLCVFGALGCCMAVMPMFTLLHEPYSYRAAIFEFTFGMVGVLTVFCLYLVPFFFARPRPWIWWYMLILLGLSMLTVYLTIFAHVLLLFWVQPEVQAAFGRRMPIQRVVVAKE